MGGVVIGHAERCFRNVPPCGDAMISSQRGPILRVMLADGIGHGSHAHGVVSQLCEHFLWVSQRSQDLISIADCLTELHTLLRKGAADRQAAVAMVDLNTDTGIISGLSVGNVKACLLSSAGWQSIPCLNGMVGGRMPDQLSLSQFPWAADALLTLLSDGVSSRGVLPYLQELVMLGSRQILQPQRIAETVIHHFGKDTDDASCVVMVRREDSPQ